MLSTLARPIASQLHAANNGSKAANGVLAQGDFVLQQMLREQVCSRTGPVNFVGNLNEIKLSGTEGTNGYVL